MKVEVFRQVHDLIHHDEFMKTYNRLRYFVYIRFMTKRLKVYITHCSNYQLNQIKRHAFYDSFTSILFSTISFHIIVMNFIVVLLLNRDMNVLLIIICKFIKKILLIIDHDTWSATNWKNKAIVVFINHDWSISRITISNRDLKFLFDFWKTVFRKLRTQILITTAWHFFENDQSKQTNQTIKIALRYHITAHSNNEWIDVLSFLQTEKNNVIHVIIEFAFNELAYDFKINDIFDLLTNLSSKNYNQLRQFKRKKTKFVMTSFIKL